MAKLAAVVLGLLILLVSHLPEGTLRPTGLHHRVEHALAYAAFACAGLLAMRRLRALPRAGAALALAVSVGAVDELTQPWFGRQCQLADWLANVAGVCAAIGLCLLLGACRRRLTRHPLPGRAPAAACAIPEPGGREQGG